MRVLLLGGYRPLVKALKKGLEDEGISVDVSVPDPYEPAPAPAAEHDAVVLDLPRPEAIGLGQLRHWRQSGLTAPVLVLTAEHDVRGARRDLRDAADAWLGKPFDLEEFLSTLRALVPGA
jgi:two-component system OmpR family response regulator